MRTVKILIALIVGVSSLLPALASAAEPDITMKATADGVIVTGKDFTATAQEASFDSAKSLLILRGTDKKRASVTRSQLGGDGDTISGRVITFAPKRRQLKVEGVDGH